MQHATLDRARPLPGAAVDGRMQKQTRHRARRFPPGLLFLVVAADEGKGAKAQSGHDQMRPSPPWRSPPQRQEPCAILDTDARTTLKSAANAGSVRHNIGTCMRDSFAGLQTI